MYDMLACKRPMLVDEVVVSFDIEFSQKALWEASVMLVLPLPNSEWITLAAWQAVLLSHTLSEMLRYAVGTSMGFEYDTPCLHTEHYFCTVYMNKSLLYEN